nr:RNA-dependent RNA polymerase [Mute swan feces associated partitiviridae D]
MPTELYSGEPFFDGWKRKEYNFESEEAKSRFLFVTNSQRGNWIDWDLYYHIKRLAPELDLHKEDLVGRAKYNPDMFRPHCRKWVEGQSREIAYDSHAFAIANARVRARFQLREKVKPIAFDQVPWKNDTNFGAPTFANSKHHPDAQSKAIAGAKAVKRGKKPEPFTAYSRGKNDQEARIVMAEPKEMFIIGGTFFYPYFEALKLVKSPYAGSTKRLAISARVNSFKWNSRFILAADYSKFDSTIPQVLISCAFNIIKDNFIMTEAEEALWEKYVLHFLKNGVLMPDGYIYYGRNGGVPSGAIFTSIIGSICNALIIEYACQCHKALLTDYLVLGDDCLIGLNAPFQKEEFASYLRHFGIEVSLEDTELHLAESYVYFLGHYWDDGVSKRPVEETVLRLVCPENVKPWNRAEFGSLNYCIGLFDKIKDYQNDNQAFWELGNKIMDSLMYPDESHKWGKTFHRGFCYNNVVLDARQKRKSGLARAFGETEGLRQHSTRLLTMY